MWSCANKNPAELPVKVGQRGRNREEANVQDTLILKQWLGLSRKKEKNNKNL